jgi:hypothetical protein
MLFALLFGLFTPVAHAEPMLTSLDEVLAQSTDIVIATYVGPVGSTDAWQASGSRLRIERALRGSLRGEIVAGVGTGHADLRAGTRVVAFLDAQRAWSFIGESSAGRRLEDTVNLRGFYDFNAHIVTPSLMTLDELVARIGGRPISWHVEGPLLALADDGSRVIETRYRIEVRASENGPTIVRGLPVRGLPNPGVSFGGRDESIEIEWSSSWPRPLEVRGEVTGRRGDVILARFWITQPDVFRERDITAYLTNGNAAYAFYRMPVVWDDGERWTVTMGEDYNGLAFRRADGSEIRWQSFDVREHRVAEGEMGTMTFAPARPGVVLDTYGDTRVFLQELLRGPMEVRIGARRGRIEWGTIEMRPPIRAR